MTWLGWFFLIAYLLLGASWYKVFEKAGKPGWQALVPGYNYWIACDIIGRKPLHALWMLFPVVNLFIHSGIVIDMARSFGRYTFLDSLLAVVAGPFYFAWLGAGGDAFISPVLGRERDYAAQIQAAREKSNDKLVQKLERENPFRKSAVREWVEAIIFAVFAAGFIRMFLIEAYVIPTPSMEGSLLVGDFLFVSKAHYGLRMPQTVAMIPLLHNRIPVLDRESYVSKPSLPYRRLKALESVDRNDPIVFNLPSGDSVFVFPDRTWTMEDFRYGAIQEANPGYHAQIASGRKPLTVRPVDKKDHYIKRCVAIAGDSLQIINRVLYINGRPADQPSTLQYMYIARFPSGNINTQEFSNWGISSTDFQALDSRRFPSNSYLLYATEGEKDKVQGMDPNIVIEPINFDSLRQNPLKLFPHAPQYYPNWSLDNYGPVWIPKAGSSVQLTPANLAMYRRCISVYEGNTLEERGGKVYVNGKETNTYTFKMNYYWMMGDNRHNSEDARFWGFVPEDHIVGKPLFIWFSLKENSLAKGINWGRIFTSADKR
jgi:signal peptidase I